MGAGSVAQPVAASEVHERRRSDVGSVDDDARLSARRRQPRGRQPVRAALGRHAAGGRRNQDARQRRLHQSLSHGGDLLDGPFPDRAYALARSVEFSFVRGNCERVPSDWDRKLLSEDDLWFLAQQPLTQSFDGVLYCHAAPDDDMPMTTVFTPDGVIAERFGGCEERTAYG